jgi:hypothetical protein
MSVSVIVSKCRMVESCYRIYGPRIFDETYETLENAQAIGNAQRMKGFSVIVRPNYNEEGFYREWRSFNGETLEECRWQCFATLR